MSLEPNLLSGGRVVMDRNWSLQTKYATRKLTCWFPQNEGLAQLIFLDSFRDDLQVPSQFSRLYFLRPSGNCSCFWWRSYPSGGELPLKFNEENQIEVYKKVVKNEHSANTVQTWHLFTKRREKHFGVVTHTAYGRNPAPPGMQKTSQIMG